MKKVLIMPDSYKGTLSAIQICDIMKECILEHFPKCETIAIPIADGGEGTVDSFLYAMNAEKIMVETTNALGEPILTYYAKVKDTAIIEMACAAGLPQVEGRLNPRRATTYGVGTIIQHAVEHNCKHIILGLGGSCTNDGGIGAALALGTIFYNQKDEPFVPCADTMTEIKYIDNHVTKRLLSGCKITAMCDIKNPLYGPNGAAYIFSHQKGADPETVKLLDQNLIALSEVIKTSFQKDVSNIPGAGAAGGFGAGVIAFFNGTLTSGIDTILDLIQFETLLENADMIFTGEGRIDRQSLGGKVVIGIGERAKQKQIPVIVIAGSVADNIKEAYHMGISAIFSINQQAMDFSQSRYFSDINLRHTMDNLLRFYKTISCQ